MEDVLDIDSCDLDLFDDVDEEVHTPSVEEMNLDSETVLIKVFSPKNQQLDALKIFNFFREKGVLFRGLFLTGSSNNACVLEAFKTQSLGFVLKTLVESRQKTGINKCKIKKIYDICRGKFKLFIGDLELGLVVLNNVIFGVKKKTESASPALTESMFSREIRVNGVNDETLASTIDFLCKTKVGDLGVIPFYCTRVVRLEKSINIKDGVRIRFVFKINALSPEMRDLLGDKFSCFTIPNEIPFLSPKTVATEMTSEAHTQNTTKSDPNFFDETRRELGIVQSLSNSVFGHGTRPNVNIGTVNFYINTKSDATAGSTPTNPPFLVPLSSHPQPHLQASRASVFSRLGPRIAQNNSQRSHPYRKQPKSSSMNK
jgi:hypothetical protein